MKQVHVAWVVLAVILYAGCERSQDKTVEDKKPEQAAVVSDPVPGPQAAAKALDDR
jgi:hypothetical protein